MQTATRAKLSTRLAATEPKVRAIYVSTYIPRECGIATYTKNLTNAINILNHTYLADIVAIDDQNLNNTDYHYPWEVKYKIQQDNLRSWLDAAEYINQSSADVVHLQHEFGIYSNNTSDGEHAVPFIEAIQKPVAVTFHTVLPNPTEIQRSNMQKVAQRADAVVVMVNAAVKWLVDVYGVDENKIVVIPHGVPDIDFTNPATTKEKLGLGKSNILMGFGLVSPGKGYEYAIEAMPSILKDHPDTQLLIVGETHPVIVRKEGQWYREKLVKTVEDLGLTKNVQFINRYLELREIIEYLKATDIYITPFPNLEQITSGTLSYAIGAGKVCVSTPYLYAEEVIDDERGVLVPPRDPEALAFAVNDLLSNPKKREEIAKKAYDYGRNMIWPSVALRHLDLFELVKNGHVHP